MFCPSTFLRKQVFSSKHKKSLEELVEQFLWCFWTKRVLEFIVFYAFIFVREIYFWMYGGRRDWCMKLGGYRSSCIYRAKEHCFKAWLFLKFLDSGEDSQSAEARSQAWREKRREKRGPGCLLTSLDVSLILLIMIRSLQASERRHHLRQRSQRLLRLQYWWMQQSTPCHNSSDLV